MRVCSPASLVGTAVEFYDFDIFGTAAALAIGPLFFPAECAGGANLAGADDLRHRVLRAAGGAVAFGQLRGPHRRKSTLVVSLLLMGVSTFLVAFLPSYAVAGWIAPALLCILRFGQGFGLGGNGAGLRCWRWKTHRRVGKRASALPRRSARRWGSCLPTGCSCCWGSGFRRRISSSWGWRVPFLASALLVVLGLWIRLRIGETPAFREAIVDAAPPPRVPLGQIARRSSRRSAGGHSGGDRVLFAVLPRHDLRARRSRPPNWATRARPCWRSNLAADVVFAIGIVVSGWWADKTSSPRTVMAVGAGLTVLVGLGLWQWGWRSGSLPGAVPDHWRARCS